MSSIIQNKFHQILGDGARTTKFNFTIRQHGGDTKLSDVITYSVKSLTLPKINHQIINIMHKGRSIPVRGTTRYDQQFTVTFYMHENHIVKEFFESWIAQIDQTHNYYDPRAWAQLQSKASAGGKIESLLSEYAGKALNYLFGSSAPDNSGSDGLPPFMTWYNADAVIEQRNFDGNEVTAIYEIKNVFPIAVDPPTYDYSSVGQIAECTVTFACSHYTLATRSKQGESLADSLLNKVAIGGSELVNKFRGQAEDAIGSALGFDVSGVSGVLSDGDDPKDFQYNEAYKTWSDFNQFDGLMRDKNNHEKYWRPDELARWDNAYNRWKENAAGTSVITPGQGGKLEN